MTKWLSMMFLAAVLLIGTASPTVRADDSEESRVSLKGITAVHVLVEDLHDDAARIGLTKESIQTDVELKLIMAGMHVVTREDWLKLPGAPRLYVNVNVLPPQAASIEVELDQNVLLQRNGQLVISANTWNLSGVLANPTSQGIRNQIKDRVDKFLSAWLSVNPTIR